MPVTPDVTVEKGDVVEVENLEGEVDRAVIVRVLEATADEHVLFEDEDDEEVTLNRYWGSVIEPSERVVRVRYVQEADDGGWIAQPGSYDFPVSRVQEVDS